MGGENRARINAVYANQPLDVPSSDPLYGVAPIRGDIFPTQGVGDANVVRRRLGGGSGIRPGFDADAEMRASGLLPEDDSWLPEHWRGMEGGAELPPSRPAPSARLQRPVAAWEVATGLEPVEQFERDIPLDRESLARFAGESAALDVQPSFGDGNILDVFRGYGEGAWDAGADTLSALGGDQGAQRRMNARGQWFGRAAQSGFGAPDALEGIGAAMTSAGMLDDPSNRHAIPSSQLHRWDVDRADLAMDREAENDPRYLGRAEEFVVEMPRYRGIEGGARQVASFVDDWVGAGAFERDAEGRRRYATADAMGDLAADRGDVEGATQWDQEARAAAGAQALDAGLNVIELAPGIGLIDIPISAGRFAGRQAVRAAGREIPEALRAPTPDVRGVRMGDGSLYQATPRWGAPAVAAGGGGALGFSAIDATGVDGELEPWLEGVGAVSGAALGARAPGVVDDALRYIMAPRPSVDRARLAVPSPQGDVIDVPFEVVEPRPQRRFEAAVQDPETGRVYAGLDHGEAIDAIPDDAVRARLQAMYDADPSFGGFNVDGRYMAREEGLASLRAERPQSVRIGEQVNRDGSVSPSDPIDWDADIAPERASWRDLGLGAAVGGGGGYALGEMFDGEAQADENGVPLDGLNLIPWLMAGGGAALFGGRQFLRNADNTVSMSGARGSRFAENVNPRNSEQSAPASGTNRARGRATGNAREEQIRRNARIMELVEEMQPTGNLPSGAANPGARLGIRLDNGHYAIAERMRAEGYPDVTRNIVTGVINRERARARRLAERAASEAEAPASAIPDSDEAAAARLGIPVDRYRQISARNPLAIGALALGTGALALTDDASASDGAPGDGWDWELPAAVGGLAALGGAAYLATRGRGNRMRVTEGMDGFSGTPKAAEDLGDGWIITHRPEMGRWAVVSPRNENGGRSTGTFTSREEALEGFRDMRAAETRMNEEVSRLQNARRDQYDNVFLGPPGSSGLPWDRAEIRIDEYAPLGPREHIVDTIDPTWSAQEIRESFNDLTPEQLQNWRVHQRPDGVWEVIADETAIRRSGSDADIAAIDSDLGRYVMGERRAYLGDMIENQRAFDREQLADNRTPLSMEGIVNLGTQGDGDRLRRRLDQSLEGYSLDPRRGDGHMIDNAPLLSIGAGTAGLGALALGAGEAGAEEGDDPDRPEQWDPMQIPFTPEQRRRYEAIMAEMDAQNERARAAAEEPVFAAPAPEPDSSEEDGLGWDDLGRIALPSILGVVGSRFNRGRNPLIGGSAGGALGGGIGAATSPEDDALSSITGGALLGLGSAVALPLIGRAGDELTPRRPNPNRPNFPPPPERIPDARERFGSLEDEMLEQELRAGRGTRETPEQGERRTRPSPIPAEERLDRPDDAIGSLRNRLMGSQFNIDRLRVMAREVGLDESGTKAELAQRLVDAARRDLAGGAPNPTPPPGTQWPPDPNANPSMVERWRRLYRQLGIPIAMTGAAVTADNDAR